MREVLLRIKRGELNLFNDILNFYLDKVYNSILISNSDCNVSKVTKATFINLYKKINKYHFWNNPESFIENNIKKYLKKHNVTYQEKAKKEVPEIILRDILVSLSSLDIKRKKISSLILIPLSVLIISVSFLLYFEAYSEKIYFPKNTIVKDEEYKLSTPVRKETRFYNGSRWTNGIVSIDRMKEDLALVKTVNKDNEYLYKIYKGKNVISEFTIDLKYFYQCQGKDDSLIFKSRNTYLRVDYNGNLIEKIDFLEVDETSNNNRFVYGNLSEYGKGVFDLSSFTIVEHIDDNIYKLYDNGEYITKHEADILQQDNNIDNVSCLFNNFINGYLVYVDLDGNVLVVDNDKKIVKKQLQFYSYFSDKKEELSNTKIYVDSYKNILIIAIEGHSQSGLEAIDINTGETIIEIEDTLSKGELGFEPILSDDNGVYVLSIQEWSYRNRQIRNLVLNFAKEPVTALELSDSDFLDIAEITSGKDSYYIYSLTNQGVFMINSIKKESK
jgi:hypothetical protein